MVEAMLCVGADVYRKGWVAVALREGRFECAHTFADAASLVAAFPGAVAVGFDIPIGLPTEGTRAADREARPVLGKRRSSVFNALPRFVIEADDWETANAVSRQRTGKGVSRQSYALRTRIFDVEPVARCDRRVIEVHPEVSFRTMAGRPLDHYKKTPAGRTERQALLATAGIELPPSLDAELRVPVEDLLDASATAWTATRYAGGKARSLPDPPETRADGGPMAIWY